MTMRSAANRFFTRFMPLLAAALFWTAFPARGYESGGFQYSVDGGNVTITNYTGSGGNLSIPAAISNQPVVSNGRVCLLLRVDERVNPRQRH